MPKTKISEFSATPANNTDIDSINIAEGCAPSGINDAIRELMAQLKDFQTGAVGDSFNGPVGTTTAAAGAFTTLSSTGNTTLGDASGDSVTINGTATFANANPTFSGGTANGVTYLNGSKVVTSGSALTFDGTNFAVGAQGEIRAYNTANTRYGRFVTTSAGTLLQSFNGAGEPLILDAPQSSAYISFNVGSTEQMRLTSTGLGIGTSSPTQKLDVAGQVTISSGNGYLWGNGAVQIYSNSSYLRFRTASTDRLEIDSSGNLGLGVTPSAWTTLKPIQFAGGASLAGFSNTGYLNANAYFDGSWRYIATASSGRYEVAADHKWYSAASGTAGNAITFTQAMTLDASGRLGIGTTSPSSYGGWISVDIRGSNGGQLIVANSAATNIGEIFTDSNGFNVSARTNNAMLFKTNDAERARIDSSGNLLVGTTSTSSTSGTGLKITAGSSQADALSIVTGATTDAGLTTYQLYSTGASAYRFYVGAGGTVFATSIVISAISDQRLKENVRDIETGLDSIMALKPRRFDWKEGKGQDKKDVAGFIAQEFETVFPECVGTSKAGEDGIEYKNINHETLIPTLVKAMQEQQAIIESLKARLDAANL